MTPRIKLPLMLALICGLLPALAPSGAYAAKGLEVAVQDDIAMVHELPHPSSRKTGLKLAAGLNASWVRANVEWSYVAGRAARKKKEPKKITYNWTGYDRLVSQAAARGMHVELSLTGSAPAYATGNHKIGPDRVKAAPFKRFAKAAAQHFGSNVTRYSIWNEPNYRGWLSPVSKQAQLYRALYISGYSAIKAVNPTAQVLIGETSPYSVGRNGRNAQAPLSFLRGVTCANSHYGRAKNCGTLKTDGFAHHPYDFHHKVTYKYPGKDNVTLATLSRLTSALTKLKSAKLLTTPSGGVPYVYLTEYGYFASGKFKIPESTRGKYLVQAFNIALKNTRVKQMLQFLLIRPPSKFLFFDTSLASRSGKPGGAYKKLAAWTKQAAKAGRIALAEATK
ncbi:MAG: hypothetical protein QOE38_326 [Thermoleophilaceae bacterium]|jgi:hypothetical protein|nr:hypothetical protein [Thermoleophilaceae bacterium]